MEPFGLVKGVMGLASIFNSCLETIAKIDVYQEFGNDSRSLSARFNAEKLRLEKWGYAVGIDQGHLLDRHHDALDDQQTCAIAMELIEIIQQLLVDKHDSSSQPHKNALPGSKREKMLWALKKKEKRVAQVEKLEILVRKLYELVPQDSRGSRLGYEPRHFQDDPSAKSWTEELQRILKRVEEEIYAETRRDLYIWLGTEDSNTIYGDSTEKRTLGTCDWIFTKPTFQAWVKSHSSNKAINLLWVNGPAGFGKTITCARVVEHLTLTLEAPVAYFFLSSHHSTREDPYSPIRSWIAQVISQDQSAFDLVRKKRLVQYERIATRLTITALFYEIVQFIPSCTFILDGLDECTWIGHNDNEERSISRFLESLRQAIESTTSRIMITSRDEPEIRHALGDEMNGDFTEYKIRNFLFSTPLLTNEHPDCG